MPRPSTIAIAGTTMPGSPLVIPDSSTLARLISEPTDRSIPPVSTASVWPRLTMARVTDCSRMFMKLARVEKRLETSEPTTIRITRSATTMVWLPLRRKKPRRALGLRIVMLRSLQAAFWCVTTRMMCSSVISAPVSSPPMVPSHITSTRSAMPITSGSSELIISTATPFAAISRMMR